MIESQSMECCVFHPTRLGKFDRAGNRYQFADWSSFREPWWQIGSSLRLPSLSPTLVMTNGRGEVLPYDHRGHALIWEPPYADSNLHYNKAAFRASGSFDVAIASQYRANPLAGRIVVSRRFYDFWRNAGLKAMWRPVILEP